MKRQTKATRPLTEAEQMTADILKYLKPLGYEAWGQPTRGEYDPGTGRWHPFPNSRRGVPDIIGFRKRDGVFIGVEVKAGSDRPRPEQTVFLDQLKAAGGLSFIAYSYAGFVQSFERRGLHISPTSMSETSTMATTAAPAEAGPACGGCRRAAPASIWLMVADQPPVGAQTVLVPGWQEPQIASWSGTLFHIGGAVIKPECWQPLPKNPSK